MQGGLRLTLVPMTRVHFRSEIDVAHTTHGQMPLPREKTNALETEWQYFRPPFGRWLKAGAVMLPRVQMLPGENPIERMSHWPT